MLNMLQNLYVKNLALIDETEVEFGEGLNILTGETGAGKSLLLGSVHLALGGKYSPDMLRNGTKSGLVELTFKIEDEQIKKHLEEMNLYPEDGFLTLSRRLMEGRSISKINGETVNTGILKDVASMLIDMKFSIKEISDRLGHESPETTWKVYAHLYPGKDRKLADALNEVRATNDNAEDKNI